MASGNPVTAQRSWHARLRLVCTRPVVRRACLAAVIVGSLLVLLNQGDVIVSGQITRRLVVKSLLTPIIPFCVTMLGAFLNSGTTARVEDLRPGRAAIRRSLIIAVVVGSTIMVLNHGDVIFSGAVTERVLLKILLTPCVPFCVSLYGAYLAYRSALVAQAGQKSQRVLERPIC
jgi:hypothetical protein